jgi:hypothetical protein
LSARKLYRSLVACGRIQAFFDLAQGYFARGITRRLKEIGLPDLREFDARAHALAGNLLSLLRWWLDRGAKETAEEKLKNHPQAADRHGCTRIRRVQS